MTSFDPDIGVELAGYRVESLIGRGGMAAVYRAEDMRLGRKVALKLLAPELSTHEPFRQRFIRESRLAASLDHPNIIPIFEAGDADGILFIAMRLVVGSDLKEIIAESGPLEPLRTLNLFAQIGDALDAAHLLGLVHRDVKPANILVASTREGADHVYLTDFGLTKRTSSLTGAFTGTGHFVGTTDYVAPEQISGKPVEPRTDIYALGCVLYQCLTGQVPFHRDDDAALLWAHLIEPPPPVSASRSDIPRDVDAVVARAMAKAVEDRYASCLDLVLDLQDALQLPPPERRPRPRGGSQVIVEGDSEPAPHSDGLSPAADSEFVESTGIPSRPSVPAGSPAAMPDVNSVGGHHPLDNDQPAEYEGEFLADEEAPQAPPGRPRWVVPLVVALIVATAVAAIGFFLRSRAQEKLATFTGDNAVPLSFKYPSNWAGRESGIKAVFSPAADKVGTLFFTNNWASTRAALQAGSSTVGLYTTYTTTPLDAGTTAALTDQLRSSAFFPDAVTFETSSRRAIVGHLFVNEVQGNLVDPSSNATRLRFITYVAQVNSTQSRSILLTFFAPPQTFESQRPEFDRILKTVNFVN
jgi:serine/threonine protein kinase